MEQQAVLVDKSLTNQNHYEVNSRNGESDPVLYLLLVNITLLSNHIKKGVWCQQQHNQLETNGWNTVFAE